MSVHGTLRTIAVGMVALAIAAAAAWAAEPPARVAVVVSAKAAEPERIAAAELAGYLHRLYPATVFDAAPALPAAGPAVLVGSLATDPSLKEYLGGAELAAPESYAITVSERGGRPVAAVVGADPLGAVFAVYALLEKLGCGFYLSFDAVPPARQEPFSFEGWPLADAPLAADRIVFNWHNFLSGCSAWNLTDWEKWIVHAQKMRYNAIMVHAYGNNPMFTFTFNGRTKPVGYLASTFRGRDWGTEHVNDVRRLFGGEVFDRPVFGADAALAPEGEHAAAAQALMKQVFAAASRRGMHIIFALDVDTVSANAQDLIATLPETARFALTSGKPAKGRAEAGLWLAAPDTAEGYAYYKAQAQSLLDLYPQIDRLAIWIRRGGTPWTELKLDQLPARWRAEFEAMAAKDPAIAKLGQAPGRFTLGKVIAAFQRALAELGRGDIRVMTGSWGFDWSLSADTFYPKDVAFLPLDYAVLHGESQLDTADRRAVVRRIADGGRRIIPVTWAHHDDGAYVGRPFTPYEDFHAKLADMGCTSFGIIHWTTRPLDLYFKSLADQVWKATENRPLKASCEAMAARCFGPAARGQGGEYLYAWVTGAPIFGRETSDTFIDRPFTPETVTQAVAGCRARLALLDRIDPAPLDPASRDRVNYFRGLEEFCIACLEAEGLYQAACADIKRGDFNSRRAEVGACPVERIIEQYARFSSLGGISRGEQGMVVALGLNWLPFFDGLRQAMALEPVRMKFGPTSHKDLAQGGGSLTFFMDAEKHLWRCYGEKETRAAEVVLPEGVLLEPAGGLPAAWAEVGRSGIAIDRPLTLHVRPFMHDVQVRGRTSTTLRPGSYRLRVILATAESDVRRAVEVKVSGGAAAVPAGGFDRYTFEPIRAKFLRILGHGNSANAWISLYEARIPTLDAAARQGAATASADAKGCVAALAVDGRMDTRWAADGDGAWIQFALTGDAPVDHIDIAWYEAGSRTYKFDLLASADGQTWTKVAAKAEAAPAPAAPGPGVPRTDRPAPSGGVWRIVESVVPATVGAAGTVDVTLTPVSGKALLCGVVLEPLEASEPDAGTSGHGPLP